MNAKLKNCLINEKVVLEFIPKESIFNVPNSPAKKGMHESAKRSLPCPIDIGTGLKNKFLTEDEIAYLSSVMGVSLEFSNKPDSYWESYSITLTVHNRILDLSVPKDFIDYKALQCWPFIAKNTLEQKQNPKEFRWVLVRPEEVVKVKTKSAMDKVQAWRIFGQHEKDKDLLLYIYYNIKGKVLDRTTPVKDLPGYFEDILDNQTASFIFTTEQEDLKTKALVFNAWITGVITQKGENYYYDGQKLAGDNEVANITNAAQYLLRPINQTIKFEIEAQFNKKKEAE